ncbi:MAG: hypothetical protein ABFS56_12760 [Pseudomonadota bacterium]
MSHIKTLLKQVDCLSVDEQKELLTILNKNLTKQEPPKIRRKWRSIRGTAPNLLKGEDAQAWILRLRSGEAA